MTMRWTGAVGVCLALIGLGCGEEPVAEEPVARPVKVLAIGSGASALSLEYPGEISAAQRSEMAFEVPGKIVEFPVDEGQPVSEGDLLARLDPRDYEARLDSERAKQNQARAEYERTRALFKAEVIAKAELDRKQRSFEVTGASVREAEKALEDTRLTANFSGTVAKKLVDDFQNVQAKEPILILQDDSTLELVVDVPERDFVRMEPGLSIEERRARSNPVVSITSIPDRAFPARIKEFATTADPVTRTFEGTFAFQPPEDISIRPGMTAKVVLTIPPEGGASSGLAIPAGAVLGDESGDAFVWVVDPSSMVVRRAPVVLGELSGSSAEIRGGLADGDLIAISGVHHLREGQQVRRLED
ncbi:efflux RND transporter periplasmic adaptor subunit [bacterium]|nr:efflux RND transporter periplasmic adaptor subunit [bacterium]